MSFFGFVLMALYTGIGRTKIIALITSVLFISNVCLNYSLIFGEFGMPAMGIGGAGLASTLAEIISTVIGLFFIFRDKEAASYFVNDIENLLKNEVFFFPASYRRAYQIEETDNANILLRAEVLNKLNNKRNPIIVTYSEALSEKVVSRKELKKLIFS